MEYEEVARGNGIDQNEYNIIIGCAKNSYSRQEIPLSENVGRAIKKSLNGEWFVFVSEAGGKSLDFSLSTVADNDYLSFSIGKTLFQVVRLKGQ